MEIGILGRRGTTLVVAQNYGDRELRNVGASLVGAHLPRQALLDVGTFRTLKAAFAARAVH